MIRKALVKSFLIIILFVQSSIISFAANSPFDIQNQFLNQARKERVFVTISLVSGERLQGYIKSFDDETILVDSSGDVLLYKHAVASINSVDGNFSFSSESPL